MVFRGAKKRNSGGRREKKTMGEEYLLAQNLGMLTTVSPRGGGGCSLPTTLFFCQTVGRWKNFLGNRIPRIANITEPAFLPLRFSHPDGIEHKPGREIRGMQLVYRSRRTKKKRS